MRLEHLISNLERRRDQGGIGIELCPPVSREDLLDVEKRLAVVLPAQVRLFYLTINGFCVLDPMLEVFPIQDFRISSDSRIDFAVVNGNRRIAFDVARLNAADQWDIIDAESGYRITTTLASFWSNKIWKWIDQRRPFWEASMI